jgi:uncharacterized membrane protein YbhN (UPF0104 family)
MKKSVENIILIGILAAFLFYFVFTYNIGQALKDIREINLTYIPYIILAWVLFTGLKFFPWLLTIRRIKVKIPIIHSFLMMYSFFGLGMGSAGIGQFIPLRSLDKYQKNARFFSVSIMIFMGATGGMAAIIIALVSSIILSKFIIYMLFVFAAAYVFLTILGFESPYKMLINFIKNHKKLKRVRGIKSALDYIEGMRRQRSLMAQRYFLLGTFSFIPSIIFEALLLGFILSAFNVFVSFWGIMFIFTVAVTIGSISMVPAGIGTEDISLIALMLIFNVPGILAITSLIIFRFLNTFLVVIVGYLTMGLLKLTKGVKK